MIESKAPLPMIIREIDPIEITTADMAASFANSDSEKQAEFLLKFAELVMAWPRGQSWPMQCRYIIEELSYAQRAEIASVLGTLMEHLEEQP